MTERIASDHDTVESHRVHLAEVGHTGRLQLPLPEKLTCAVDDVVSVCFDGSSYYSQVSTTLDDELVLRGSFVDQGLARTRDGENELAAWLEDTGVSDGDPLLLDVLTPGYAYGLRRPGERVVYGPPEQPDSSLTAIARSLDGE